MATIVARSRKSFGSARSNNKQRIRIRRTKFGDIHPTFNYSPKIAQLEYSQMSNNEFLADYFNEESKFTDDSNKKAHYDYVCQLLWNTQKDIDCVDDFRKLLKEGGYKSSNGLIEHYKNAEHMMDDLLKYI